MHITVLGGAGKMGSIAVQALANDSRVDQVVIADLNLEQAKIVATYLDNPKLKIQQVDITDHEALANCLRDTEVCLNASVYYTNLNVMEACLVAGVHYTDMGGLFHLTRKQLEYHDRFFAADRSAVLGMGSAPGVPNVQARYAADRLDAIDSIKIYDGVLPPPPDDERFTYAVPTIIDELTLEPMVFVDGKFEARPPLSGFEDYMFTQPIGLQPMHFSLHSEVATLPISFGDRGIRECFFKINYWGMAKRAVDKVRTLVDFGFDGRDPIQVGEGQVVPREVMIALLSRNVPPITEFLAPPKKQPPDWAKEIVTEVQGTKDGVKMTFRLGTLTCKGALPTGVAPAVTAIWLAEGRIKPGVYPPEAVVDPEPFFEELKAHGIYSQVTISRTLS